jgi:chromosome segregation ATPase
MKDNLFQILEDFFPFLNLAGLGAIGYYVYYILKGVNQKIKNLSELTKEQKMTAEVIRERAEEYKVRIDDLRKKLDFDKEKRLELNVKIEKLENNIKEFSKKNSDLIIENNDLKSELRLRRNINIIKGCIEDLNFKEDEDICLYINLLIYNFFKRMNYSWSIKLRKDEYLDKRKIIISIDDKNLDTLTILQKQKKVYIDTLLKSPKGDNEEENNYKVHKEELNYLFSDLPFNFPIGIHFNHVQIFEFNNSW